MNGTCMNLVHALTDHYDDAFSRNDIDETEHRRVLAVIDRLTPDQLEQKLKCITARTEKECDGLAQTPVTKER
jgi:hypothetical protein